MHTTRKVYYEFVAATTNSFSLLRNFCDVERWFDITFWRKFFLLFMFKVLGSQTEYHFIHRALPHARNKRSVPHTRRLKIDPLVSRANYHIHNLYSIPAHIHHRVSRFRIYNTSFKIMRKKVIRIINYFFIDIF